MSRGPGKWEGERRGGGGGGGPGMEKTPSLPTLKEK